MKKLLLPLLGLTISGAAYAAVGDTFTQDMLSYEVIAEGQVAVTDCDNALTVANIPSTVTNEGTTYTVTTIGEEAFYWSKITSAVVPPTVTTIQNRGFYSCDNLTSVTLNEGLKTIGDYGFGYAKISAITLPATVESIGNSCFFRCDNLTSVVFPASLKKIGTSCFYKVPLTQVVLPDGLETLGAKAFLSCSQLTDVTLPANLKEIGDGTFYGCKISSITVPSSVTTIGEEAFYDCPLTQFELPAALETIGSAAFSGTQIAKFGISADNTHFVDVDDAIFTADKSLLVVFPPKSTKTELTLPSQCIGISGGAFDRTVIQKVTVGNKFRAIDAFAFCQSKLSEINFPESLVFIGEQAFAGTNLTNVVLPKALPELQQAAFAECKALSSVTIPASMTYIDIRAFFGCTSLVTINCEGMTPPVLEDWYEAYESPFYNVPESATCNIPKGATTAYSKSNWGEAFTTFTESLPAQLVPTEISPADNAQVEEFGGVTLTFGESVTIVETNPTIKVIEGSLVAGVPVGNTVSVDDWMVTSQNGNKMFIWPADYDYYTAPFKMEVGKDYYVTIPAGIIQNAAGEVNCALTLHYVGTYEPPVVQLESVTPANDSNVTEICNLSLKFVESVSLQQSKLSSIKVVKGSLVDGVPTGETISVDQWFPVSGKTSGTVIEFFAADYDGYTAPIAVAANADYYVVLPAGLFRLSSSYSTTSDEIILHYTNKGTGIGVIEAENAADAPVEIYTIDGVRVDEMQKGRIYIVRQGNKVTKQIGR